MNAVERLESLCYGGETLVETYPVDAGAIGITSHRVLALMPDGPDARFHAIDRPNVTGVATRTTGPTGHRNRGVMAGVIGLVLLAAGSLIGLGSFQQLEPPPDEAFEGLATVIAALGLLDDALRALGLFTLLVGLGFLVWYFRGAGWVIEIGVAGEDPVRVPIARNETEAADRLEAGLAEVRPGGIPDPSASAVR